VKRLGTGADATSNGVDGTRTTIKEWLSASLPSGWPECGSGPWVDEWRRRFYADGWAVPTWPAHLGGLGLDQAASRVVNEELAAVEAGHRELSDPWLRSTVATTARWSLARRWVGSSWVCARRTVVLGEAVTKSMRFMGAVAG